MSNLGVLTVVTLAVLVGLLIVLRLRNRGDQTTEKSASSDGMEVTEVSTPREHRGTGDSSSAEGSGEADQAVKDDEPGGYGLSEGVATGETEVTAGGPAVRDEEEEEGESERTRIDVDEELAADAGSEATEGAGAGEGDEAAHIGEPGSEAFDPETGDVVEEADGDEERGEPTAGAPEQHGGGGRDEPALDEEETDSSGGAGIGEPLGEGANSDEELWDVPDSLLGDEEEDENEDAKTDAAEVEKALAGEGELDEEGGDDETAISGAAGEEGEVEADGEDGEGEADRHDSGASDEQDPDHSDEDEKGYGMVNPPGEHGDADEASNPQKSGEEEPSVLGFEGPHSGSTDESVD